MSTFRTHVRIGAIQSSFGVHPPPEDGPKDALFTANESAQGDPATRAAEGLSCNGRLVKVNPAFLATLKVGQLVAVDLTAISEPASAKPEDGKSPDPGPIHPEHATA